MTTKNLKFKEGLYRDDDETVAIINTVINGVWLSTVVAAFALTARSSTPWSSDNISEATILIPIEIL